MGSGYLKPQETPPPPKKERMIYQRVLWMTVINKITKQHPNYPPILSNPVMMVVWCSWFADCFVTWNLNALFTHSNRFTHSNSFIIPHTVKSLYKHFARLDELVNNCSTWSSHAVGSDIHNLHRMVRPAIIMNYKCSLTRYSANSFRMVRPATFTTHFAWFGQR